MTLFLGALCAGIHCFLYTRSAVIESQIAARHQTLEHFLFVIGADNHNPVRLKALLN